MWKSFAVNRTFINFFSCRNQKWFAVRKKISMLQQNFGTLRQYVPAELKHNSRGWYIEYYRLKPTINMNERVRLMMNRERKRWSSDVCSSDLVAYRVQTADQRYYSSNQQPTCCRLHQSPTEHARLWSQCIGCDIW